MKRFFTLLAFLLGLLIAPVAAQQVVRIFGTQSGGTITAALVDSTGRLLVSVAGGAITPTSVGVDASTCAAPGLFENGAATTGIAFTATPTVLTCVGGTTVLTATAAALRALSTASIGWSTDVTLFREGANHFFQRNSTNAQRASWANTYTSSTNYEAFSVDWQTTANYGIVGTRTAATGTSRPLFLVSQSASGANAYMALQISNSAPYMRFGFANAAGTFSQSTGTATTFVSLSEFTSTATSGTNIAAQVIPTYNQSSGTAANTDLLINRTETAVGSGAQYLLEGQRGGTLQFAIRTGRAGAGMQIRTAQQTVPTCSTNCGTSPSISGTDTAMTVTMGSSGVPASGWVVTFNGTWASNPACIVQMAKAGMVVGKMPLTVVTTTTTITVVTNGTAPATTDMYHILCMGIS